MALEQSYHANRAILFILEGQEVVDKLLSPRPVRSSEFQFMDELAKQGSTTTIVHPNVACPVGTSTVYGNILFTELKALAKKISHSTSTGKEIMYPGRDPMPDHPGILFLEDENLMISLGQILLGIADQPFVIIRARNGITGVDAFINVLRLYQKGEEKTLDLDRSEWNHPSDQPRYDHSINPVGPGATNMPRNAATTINQAASSSGAAGSSSRIPMGVAGNSRDTGSGNEEISLSLIAQANLRLRMIMEKHEQEKKREDELRRKMIKKLKNLERYADPYVTNNGKLLMGVCALGNWWTDHTNQVYSLEDVFPIRQSSQVAILDEKEHTLPSETANRHLVPVGAVSWVGNGLVRADDVVAFDGTVASGCESLLLSQIFKETMSKVGLVRKYGAK